MSWTDEAERYRRLARGVDPAVRLTTKDGWVWRAIAWVLYLITFSAFKRERFLTQFATTLGPVQAYPRGYLRIYEGTIEHEGRHTRQARAFGLWIHPWVGLPFMAVAYLLLPFPVYLAWGRYRLELDAVTFSWERGLRARRTSVGDVMEDAARWGDLISSAAYFWAWPRRLARWGFRRRAEHVTAEYLREVKPRPASSLK